MGGLSSQLQEKSSRKTQRAPYRQNLHLKDLELLLLSSSLLVSDITLGGWMQHSAHAQYSPSWRLHKKEVHSNIPTPPAAFVAEKITVIFFQPLVLSLHPVHRLCWGQAHVTIGTSYSSTYATKGHPQQASCSLRAQHFESDCHFADTEEEFGPTVANIFM